MSPSLFERRAVREHRQRARPYFATHDFLHREVAARLADRLLDVRRQFARVAAFGTRGGVLVEALAGVAGIEQILALDLVAPVDTRNRVWPVVADDEMPPLAAGCFDLVLSLLSLHSVNDVPGALVQLHQALRPDGLFLGALLGGNSLIELRDCLTRAEAELTGGARPRVAPMTDLRDVAALMQRAGFALPIVDIDAYTVTYPDPFALMRELRFMGEGNALAARARHFTPRRVLMRAAALYAERYGQPDGRVRASFEVITAMGWRPAASQQQPLRPGSAGQRLAEALGTVEHPAGEKATR